MLERVVDWSAGKADMQPLNTTMASAPQIYISVTLRAFKSFVVVLVAVI